MNPRLAFLAMFAVMVVGLTGAVPGRRAPGEYQVQVALSGFEAMRRSVRVQSGAAVAVSLTLSVGLREQVVVSATKIGTPADIQSVPLAIAVVSNLAARTAAWRPTRSRGPG